MGCRARGGLGIVDIVVEFLRPTGVHWVVVVG